MANNDRVTKTPSPSWIADNQSSGKLLVTKKINGVIGWNNEEVTRNLLSRDAFNRPGWRDKIVIPAGKALIEYDNTLFAVVDASNLDPILSGSLIDLGSQINIYLLAQTYQYGCRAEITNGTTVSQYFLKNFGSIAGRSSPNLVEGIMIVGNTMITGVAKRRSDVGVASGTANVIQANVTVNSWGDKGSQTESNWTLTQAYSSPPTLEFYEGDELSFTFVVSSGYHWANFKSGTDINQMYLVNKALVVYPQGVNGGQYNLTTTSVKTYLSMDAVKPITLYLYQPTSSTFTRSRAKVHAQNSNLVIYRNVEQPAVGTNIEFGKNGVAPTNPIPLYVGMQIEVYNTSSRKIHKDTVVSYTSLAPSLPALSTSDPDIFTYSDNLIVTILGNANENGYICVGLRYVDQAYSGNSVVVEKSGWDTPYDFKTFMDNYYYSGQEQALTSYFTNRIHRDYYQSSPITQSTTALMLGFKASGTMFNWTLRTSGYFQSNGIGEDKNGSAGSATPQTQNPSDNKLYYVINGAEASDLNCGFFTIPGFYAKIRGDFQGGGNIGTTCTISAYADCIASDIDAPVADWYLPDDPSRYIPLATLQSTWGSNPWRVKTLFIITPVFVAIVGEA